jgi:uncharacterized protein involved in type VI secretion and phage assembly
MIETKSKIRRYFGKYRGTVTNNKDDEHRGRIKAEVPAVFGKGKETTWAEPCVPFAGNDIGFFFIPPEKANVWIEFEQGDHDKPIWTGCFWSKKDNLPVSPAVAEMKVLKTDTATITLNDQKGIATIEMKSGMKLVMNKQEGKIELINGKGASVKLENKKVSINGEMLEVE